MNPSRNRDDLQARFGARAVPPPAELPLWQTANDPTPIHGQAPRYGIEPGEAQADVVVEGTSAIDSKASDAWSRARAGSEAAARAWTPDQVARVDAAIAQLAATGVRFTADDVWRLAGPTVPVTKGLAARLNAAARAGVIRNTGETSTASRGGKHDHAQRLTVWTGGIR